jgi:hypothetical protein
VDEGSLQTGASLASVYNRATLNQPVTLFKDGCQSASSTTFHHPSCHKINPTSSFTAAGATLSYQSGVVDSGLGGDGCGKHGSCVGSFIATDANAVNAGDKIQVDYQAKGSDDDFETAVVLYATSSASAAIDLTNDKILDVSVSRGGKQTCEQYASRATPMQLEDFKGNLVTITCTPNGAWREFVEVPSTYNGHVYFGFFAASYDATGGTILGASLTIEAIQKVTCDSTSTTTTKTTTTLEAIPVTPIISITNSRPGSGSGCVTDVIVSTGANFVLYQGDGAGGCLTNVIGTFSSGQSISTGAPGNAACASLVGGSIQSFTVTCDKATTTTIVPSAEEDGGYRPTFKKKVYISSHRQVNNLNGGNPNWCDGEGHIMSWEIVVDGSGTVLGVNPIFALNIML